MREERRDLERHGSTRNGHGHGHGHGNGSSSKEIPARSRTRMVGDWQLQKTLGAGSMGKVKLATNIHTKERVSLATLLCFRTVSLVRELIRIVRG